MADEDVFMPQLGESIVEATVAQWHVGPGDQVQRGQPVAEVETDKASNDVPAPTSGTVREIVVPQGQTVPVGAVIMKIHPDGGTRPSIPPPATARLPSNHLAPTPSNGASPAVRRIARQHDVDLESVPGTGRRGRITRKDVLATVESPGLRPTLSLPPAPATVPPPARASTARDRVYHAPNYQPQTGDDVVPFSKRRQFIAEHMIHSLGTAAHVAAVTEIDMHEVRLARTAERPNAEARNVRLTFTPYVIRAVLQAIDAFPTINATVKDNALIVRRARNIGFAVETDAGLIVPVIKNADELGLFGIARAVERLSNKARDNDLGPDDLVGGSFTVSNPGKDGNLFGISIIRQPEVAILRIGAIVKRAVVKEMNGEDAIVIRPMMYAALSYDHRVIDGATGNGFLGTIKARLETPQPIETTRPAQNPR